MFCGVPSELPAGEFDFWSEPGVGASCDSSEYVSCSEVGEDKRPAPSEGAGVSCPEGVGAGEVVFAAGDDVETESVPSGRWVDVSGSLSEGVDDELSAESSPAEAGARSGSVTSEEAVVSSSEECGVVEVRISLNGPSEEVGFWSGGKIETGSIVPGEPALSRSLDGSMPEGSS